MSLPLAPYWCRKFAIATEKGWVHEKTGELLISKKGLLDSVNESVEVVKEVVDIISDHVEEIVDEVSDALVEIKEEIKETVDEIKEVRRKKK